MFSSYLRALNILGHELRHCAQSISDIYWFTVTESNLLYSILTKVNKKMMATRGRDANSNSDHHGCRRYLIERFLMLYPNVIPKGEIYTYTKKNKVHVVKSLLNICFETVAKNMKRPYKKYRTLQSICIMRNNLLSLGLPNIINVQLLKKILPTQEIRNSQSLYDKKILCRNGHNVQHLEGFNLINFFCDKCCCNSFNYTGDRFAELLRDPM
ncbi:hypothetical protein [Trichoplusia ni ascovirus 2c]|uniref:hypothetical protein n=1 Tax=Trichoplusia ni ascovirus 2c TaxID=328615 RepID=UPI0000E44232|nr:hypothetical protein TNAV2c_gp090 [Trichoplusia ni ascovirus 2c]ABF70607.1 hypothetical protein [Trichoplusia ni ascovirus 2c]